MWCRHLEQPLYHHWLKYGWSPPSGFQQESHSRQIIPKGIQLFLTKSWNCEFMPSCKFPLSWNNWPFWITHRCWQDLLSDSKKWKKVSNFSPGMLRDSEEGEGVLTLQVRSPRILASSIVHGEVILPLSKLPSVSESEVFGVPHLRLPLTRPWDFKCQYLLFYGCLMLLLYS